MQLCSKHHTEVCYDSYNCPACELVDKINELEGDLKREQKKRDEIEAMLEDVQADFEQFKEETKLL